MSKLNLIYFSPSGTTEKVIKMFASNFENETVNYNILNEIPKENVSFDSEDITVFAVPVFAGRVPAVCAERLNFFKGSKTPAIVMAVYGNREYDDALLELTDIVKKNGFVVIGAGAFIAQHSIFNAVAEGRPDAKDESALIEFSTKCKDVLNNFTGAEVISVKGNSPYMDAQPVPFFPESDSKCDECGACATVCPANAIPGEHPSQTIQEKCIACTACIHICPQKSRAFRGEKFPMISQGFAAKNSERKEPEFFIASL